MRTTGTALICIGMLAMLLGLSSMNVVPASAQSLPERPTLTPVPPPSQPGSNDSDDDDDTGSPAPGRITGTVIDLATGAPAAGITVMVGDVPVVSDANGNYDRGGLAPGDYTIVLTPPEGRGAAAQAPVTVTLAAGETVVRHLAFGVAPTVVPTTVPEVPVMLPQTAGEPMPGVLWFIIGFVLILAGGTLSWAARRTT